MDHASTLQPVSPRKQDWPGACAALLLVGLTVLAMGRSVGNDFTWWDDAKTIHHNPALVSPDAALRGSYADVWTKPEFGLYAPLTSSYWRALARLAERPVADAQGIHHDARVFHAGSLALHTAAVLVVFAILRLLTTRVWAAAAGAAVFAAHPLQVEAVAWASGAKDVLAGLLGACALYLYLLAARGAGTRAKVHYFAAVGVLVLAMLAKPSAMVVPAIALALDRWVLGRDWRTALRATAGLALAVLPLMVVARLAQTATGVADVAVWQRPLIAGDALAFYLWKLIWPVDLAPDYGRRPAVVLQMWNGVWPYVAWLLPATVALIAWRMRRAPASADQNARPAIAWAAVVVFVLGAAPVLGLVPFMFQYMSTVADHYLYVSMIGPAIAVAAAAAWAADKSRAARPAAAKASSAVREGPWAVRGAFGLLIAAWATLSADQCAVWRDDVALWRHTMAVSPDSFVAPNNLAANLGREGSRLEWAAVDAAARGDAAEADRLRARRRDLTDRATALLEQSIAIHATYLPARQNAAANYARLGQWDRAAAHLEGLLAANQRAPAYMRENFTTFHNAAGHLWARAGRYDKAAAHFEEFLARVPGDAATQSALSEARSRIAEARIE
ncbi:MAG TPA: hypothetical protein VEA69_18855 [Tepidisphaeraceae bacterium]|nr:hypothetical protein [Tepidisphaeraceae bacterium]